MSIPYPNKEKKLDSRRSAEAQRKIFPQRLCASARKLLLCLFFFLATPAQADTLIDHLNGLTLNEQGEIERFTGILIGNDGRIIQLLRRADKRPTKLDYAVDAQGSSAIPGFVLGHAHILDIGFAALARESGKPPPINAKPRPEDRDLALATAQNRLLKNGITSATDSGITIEDWQTYRRAGDNGTLHMRIIAFAKGAEAMVLIGGPAPTPWLYEDHLRLNGVALTLDGSLASYGALLSAPYADAPLKRPTARLTEIQLKNLMSRAAMDHFQVAIEAHGDAAISLGLNAITELSATYAGDRRWRVEGADVINSADLSRFAANGTQVIAAINAQTIAEHRLGAKRLSMAYPWKSLLTARATLAFGADDSADVPNPFAVLATAMTRFDANSQPFGGWQSQERLSFEQALSALTTGPAYAAFAETRIGRLAVGMRADFLLIDSDLQLAAPSDIRHSKVLQTWVGGKLVYTAPSP
ncbi:MAG: hypothetical protein RLY97_290 [Pseudomonadota bacterium]